MNEHKLPAHAVFDAEDYPRIAELKAKAKNLFFTGLPSMISEHGILAGGTFASWMHDEEPRDYDIFFLGTKEVQEMYDDWFISHLVGDGSYGVTKQEFIYSKKLRIKSVWNHPNRKAQYIFTDYATREEMIDEFDFVHAKMSYSRHKENKEGTIYTSKQTLDAIRLMHLIPTGKQTLSPKRVEKFLDRGWIEVKKSEPTTTPYIPTTSKTPYIDVDLTTSIIPQTYSIGGGGAGRTLYPQTLTPSEDFKEEIKKLLGTYNPGEEEKNRAIKVMEEKTKAIIGTPKKDDTDWFNALKTKLSRPWDN